MQVLATVFLILIIAGVIKMVLDVQVGKVKNILNEVERMQVLAGIKPHDKKTKKKLSPHITGVAELPGVDIEGIEQLAERFQKLAHIQESSENVGKKGETTIYE